MTNPFIVWAIITTLAFVFGWSYLMYASLSETEFPKAEE